MIALLEFRKLRPATDLLATVAFNSLWIPIRGARQFSFYLRSTGGQALTSLDIQVRRNGAGPKSLVGATAGTGLLTDAVIGAMNNPGLLVNVYPDPALGINNIPMWDEARLAVVGHGTLSILGFSVEAQVVDDNKAAQNDDDPSSSNVSSLP